VLFLSRMRRPTISVLCPTAHPGPLVAESLSALREAVDEIVVAADVRVEATDLAYYRDVADVLVRYEHSGANRHWPWLAAQAQGDWIFLLDGDELPSAALLAALPALVADRRVRQYSLPVHWPWPAPNLRLAEEPWISDRRLRLVRNDPELTFAARKHALVDADPPIRFLDELPVYHLDLLLPDLARRKAKVARYDSELFGLLTSEGIPFNQAFYLPEAGGGDRETVHLPAEDAERVARALSASRYTSRQLDPTSFPLHDRETVAWYAPRTALPEEAYRGAIELARPMPRFTAGCPNHFVWVEVTNEGTAHWPGRDGREPQIRLGVCWRPPGGGPHHDAGRALLPHALDPGQSALLPLTVGGPPEAGPTELVLDLVHENVRWFGSPFAAQVEVGPSVDERLAALTERHGPLIPLEAAMDERRAVGARDGLLRQALPDAAATDPEMAKLTASLPIGAWAIDAEAIDRLVELVRAERPGSIVEFGSGTSTVVLASLLAELHKNGPRLVSFEQDPAWAEHSRAALAERGLDQMATVIQLPLGESTNGPPGYVLTEAATKLLRRFAPRLILVDGPTLDSGASRLGTLDLVAPYLREDATVLLDDALRDAELCIAAAWERRDDVTLHGIRATPKGLLEATLRAPKRHRQRIAAGRGGVRRATDSPDPLVREP
jgi:Methyltransferase domain